MTVESKRETVQSLSDEELEFRSQMNRFAQRFYMVSRVSLRIGKFVTVPTAGAVAVDAISSGETNMLGAGIFAGAAGLVSHLAEKDAERNLIELHEDRMLLTEESCSRAQSRFDELINSGSQQLELAFEPRKESY